MIRRPPAFLPLALWACGTCGACGSADGDRSELPSDGASVLQDGATADMRSGGGGRPADSAVVGGGGGSGGSDGSGGSGGDPVADLVALAGELTPVVLSVSQGEAPCLVGGSPGATGGFVACLEGERIVRVPAATGRLLWWIWAPDPQTGYAVGEGARILRRTPAGFVDDSPPPATLEDPDGKAVLWGVWGANADDVWAVGGSIRPGGPKALVLRRGADGVWRRLWEAQWPPDANFFKVWGTGPDDVHIIGDQGAALHWNGSAMRVVPTPAADIMFTVHGSVGGPVLAAGGAVQGRVWRFSGDAWTDDGAPSGPPLNGVSVRADGTAVATGNNGLVLQRSAEGRWSRLSTPELRRFTLHAVSASVDLWVVGGDLAALTPGVIATTRRPLPILDIADLPPPPDSGTPDAAGPPVDAGSPMDARPSADVGPTADARLSDGRHPDGDGPVPDAAPPAPDAQPLPPDGPAGRSAAAPCDDDLTSCRAGLECLSVFTPSDGFTPPICLQTCDTPETCDPGFGPSPCCIAPGPQLATRYCVPAVYHPAGCPGGVDSGF